MEINKAFFISLGYNSLVTLHLYIFVRLLISNKRTVVVMSISEQIMSL